MKRPIRLSLKSALRSGVVGFGAAIGLLLFGMLVMLGLVGLTSDIDVLHPVLDLVSQSGFWLALNTVGLVGAVVGLLAAALSAVRYAERSDER